MTLRSFLLIATIMLASAPLSAHATGCREWNRMSESRKWDRIDRMIDDAVRGQRGRSYQVNRNAIARCLAGNSEDMFWDFKNYLWTCVDS